MLTLFIDTSDNTKTTVKLEGKDINDALVQEVGRKKSQIVLTLIDTLLAKHSLRVEDIEAITVALGPGSFTGLRVGVAIANTLAYALTIPINGGKPGEAVEPTYN